MTNKTYKNDGINVVMQINRYIYDIGAVVGFSNHSHDIEKVLIRIHIYSFDVHRHTLNQERFNLLIYLY